MDYVDLSAIGELIIKQSFASVNNQSDELERSLFAIFQKLNTSIKIGLSTYCQTSNISLIKSHNLNVRRLGLQLSLPNPLKLGVKSRMKM